MTFFLLNLKQKSILFPEEIGFLVLKKKTLQTSYLPHLKIMIVLTVRENLPLMELPVNIIKCNESGLEQEIPFRHILLTKKIPIRYTLCNITYLKRCTA